MEAGARWPFLDHLLRNALYNQLVSNLNCFDMCDWCGDDEDLKLRTLSGCTGLEFLSIT